MHMAFQQFLDLSSSPQPNLQHSPVALRQLPLQIRNPTAQFPLPLREPRSFILQNGNTELELGFVLFKVADLDHQRV